MKVKTSFVLPIVAALLLAPVPGPASAEIGRFGVQEAMALCPSIGRTGMLLGEPLARQMDTPTENMGKLPPKFAPFTFEDAEFTPWSGQLAGVAYLGENQGEASTQAWATALENSLREAGWVESARKDIASAMANEPKLYEKSMDTTSGRRTMLIEFDTSGVLAYRCGDGDLFELSRDERDGRLAPGSQRPQPTPDAPAVPLPTAAECSNPATLAAFNTPGQVDEDAAAVRQMTAGGAQINERKKYQERLHTWLVWTLRSTAKVSQERIWEIEEAAGPVSSVADELADMREFLAEGAKIGDTQDPPGFCKSVVALIQSIANQERRAIDRWAAINRALEEEAGKIGVQVGQ